MATKTKKTTKAKVVKKEKTDESQATYNAIGALTEISQSHRDRIATLEQDVDYILERLDKVLERMGLHSV